MAEQEEQNEVPELDTSLEGRKANMQAFYRHKAGAENSERMNRAQFMSAQGRQNILRQIGADKANSSKDSGFDYADFGFVLAVAAFWDLLSFAINLIPGIGGIVSSIFIAPPAWLNLIIMYQKRGIKMSFLKFGATGLGEFIPVLNALPFFMMNVLMSYTPPKLKKVVGGLKAVGK